MTRPDLKTGDQPLTSPADATGNGDLDDEDDQGDGPADRPGASPSSRASRGSSVGPEAGSDKPDGRVAQTARNGLVGFLMGSADVVPGVSGGTIALVGGIYTRLVDAVRDGSRALTALVRGRPRACLAELRRLDWTLVVPVVVGIGIAVVSLAAVLDRLLDEQPVRLAGLFLGLVLGSILVAARLFKGRVDGSAIAVAAVVAVAVFLLLGLRQETTAEAADAATAPLWAFPLAAALAICAMILPGVSGAFILVTIGMYQHVLAAVNDRDLGLVVLFLLGAVVGLALFSRVLSFLLHRHHDVLLAAMIGLMLGSLRVLWPWPGGPLTTELSSPSGDVALPVLLAVAGFVAVVALGRFGLRSRSER